MDTLNQAIQEYTSQLQKAKSKKAYRGIMAWMTSFSKYLANKYPDCSTSALYFGYLDMTYFSFTPPDIKRRSLKFALVYLHAENRFEAWLGGVNRAVQADLIEKLRACDLGCYKLSRVAPGVDSIVESVLAEQPDFDHPEILQRQIEGKLIGFAEYLAAILKKL